MLSNNGVTLFGHFCRASRNSRVENKRARECEKQIYERREMRILSVFCVFCKLKIGGLIHNTPYYLYPLKGQKIQKKTANRKSQLQVNG